MTNNNRLRPAPPWPTKAPPGSPEKVRVLIWRAEQGYALWHPDDASDASDAAASPDWVPAVLYAGKGASKDQADQPILIDGGDEDD